MQQWEYCALKGLYFPVTNRTFGVRYPALVYFTPDGPRLVEIRGSGRNPQGKDAALEEDLTGQAMARLGVDGWKMVGTSEHSGVVTAYFKRPVAETV